MAVQIKQNQPVNQTLTITPKVDMQERKNIYGTQRNLCGALIALGHVENNA